MGRYEATLLLAIAALSAVSAFHDLVPRGKELVYEYKGVIKAGTNIPSKYASVLFVDGKLHLQLEGHGVVAQLSNLTYKLYNGELYYGYENDLIEVDLPKESDCLLNPFKMSYHSHGQLKSLSMEKSEKMYARNMHRAIASLLQMDCKKVNFHSDKSHAFTVDEQNLYGKSTTEYYVRTEDGVVIVQKMHDMKTTDHIYTYMNTNIGSDYCEARYEEPVFHDSQQEYRIEKLDNSLVAKHIETTGSFRYHPFRGQSEDQYVSVRVSLKLLDMTPITTTRTRKSEQTEYDFNYRMYDTSVDPGFIDLTNGRHPFDSEKHADVVMNKLKQMGEFLHDPLNEKDASAPAVIGMLSQFDMTALEKLYAKLCEKTTEHEKVQLRIFHQILPQVGTHAAAMLTKKLIYEKKVEDEVAHDMLSVLPVFIKIPTEKFLKELEDMLTWDDKIEEQVRRSAILCFSSLVHLAFKEQQKHMPDHDKEAKHSDHLNLRYNDLEYSNYFSKRFSFFRKKQNYFERFVKKMVEKMDTSDVPTQILYVTALTNAQLPYVVEHLAPFASGQKPARIMTRVWSLWALAHVSVGNSDYIYELCWPLFANPSEHEEIRIVAYYILMESHPSITRMLNIKERIEKERDTELYNLHYSYVNTMSQTTDSCHQVTRLNLAQVFKNAPPPTRRGMSYYYQIDYFNTKYGYGEDVNLIWTGTKTSRLAKFEKNVQLFNIRYTKYYINFRISGLEETILDKIQLNLNSTTALFNYDQIFKTFNSIPNMKDVEIYLDYAMNNKIVRSFVFNGTNISQLYDMFNMFTTSERTESLISFNEQTTIPFPTEMGVPVVLQFMMPYIQRFNLNIKKEDTDNGLVVHFDNHYYFSQRNRYGLSFYNAIADIWQGLGKFHSFEFQFPLFGDLSVDTKQRIVKVTLKWHGKDYKDAIAIKVLTSRQLTIKGDHDDILIKSCPKCTGWVETTREMERTTNETKQEFETDGGHHVEISYESDRYGSATVFEEWLNIFESKDKKNYESPLDYLQLVSYDWMNYIMYQPPPAITKLSITITPCTDYKTAQRDITLRFTEKLTQDQDEFLPGIKHFFRASTTLINKDKVINTWDVYYTMDLNCGHNLQRTNLEIRQTVPTKKDFKLCYDGLKEFTYWGVFSNASVTVEGPDDETQSYEILTVAKPVDEQTSPSHAYGVCLPFVGTPEVDFYSRTCLAAHTSIRKYTYNIKATTCSEKIAPVFDRIKGLFKEYYSHTEADNKHLLENEAIVTLTYPYNDNEMNVAISTPHQSYYFDGMPSTCKFGWYPDNTHASRLYMFMHEHNFVHICTANVDEIKPVSCDKQTVVANELGNEWTMFVGNVESNCQHGVFLKKIKDTKYMAMKTVHGDRSVEMYPCGDHYEKIKILVDGKEVDSPLDYNTDNWFSYLYREHDHLVAMNTLHFYLHMEYTGESITIEIPKVDGVKFYGKCFA